MKTTPIDLLRYAIISTRIPSSSLSIKGRLYGRNIHHSYKKRFSLSRRVEMYAWKEIVHTRKEGDKEIKTYTYEKEWTFMPQKSANFHVTEGHINPAKTIKDDSFQVSKAKVGNLAFDASSAKFYKNSPLTLKKTEVLQKHGGQKTMLSNDGLFLYLPLATAKANQPKPVTQPVRYDPQTGQRIQNTPPVRYDPVTGRPLPPPIEAGYNPNTGRPVAPVQKAVMRDPETDPKAGDQRINYHYFEGNQEGTVVGSWKGNKISPHVYRKTGTFLGVYPGSSELFAVYLEKQHRMMSWVIRIASFLMLWIGMNMILGPIMVTVGVIPVLGHVGKGMISLVTGVIALVLWFLTFTLANLWLALLIAAVVIIGLLIYFKKKKAATPPAPAAA